MQAVLLLALILAAFQPAPSPAQAPAETPVVLLTISPGPAAWERFGHDALVVDGVAYDWGRFDFGESATDFLLFAGRFIQGDMPYGFGGADADLVANYYVKTLGRRVTVTALHLTPEQHRRLRYALADEPAVYPYNYFTANCATKLRDLLNEATDGQIERAFADAAPAEAVRSTYRREVDRHTADSWWLWFALQAGMGEPTDAPIDGWQQSFLPAELDRHLDAVTNTDGQPLVAWRKTLGTAEVTPRVEPPIRWPIMLGIGVGAGLFLAAVGRWTIGRLLSGAVLIVIGLGSCVLVYFWLFTNHYHASPNASALLLAPLSLPLGLAMATRRWTMKRILAGGVGICIVAGLVLWVVLGQHAEAIAAAVVPPQVAGMWIAVRERRKMPDAESEPKQEPTDEA